MKSQRNHFAYMKSRLGETEVSLRIMIIPDSMHTTGGKSHSEKHDVSRFTWQSLEVRLDGKIMASVPQVTKGTASLGYELFTFQSEKAKICYRAASD